MAFALGSALMARDVSRERKDLREEEKRLQKAGEAATEAQQKKGMWGSIGKTLGSIGAGALGTMVGGPAGGILAAKMAGSYLGGRIGQGLVDTSEEYDALKSQVSKGNFLSSEREDLRDFSTEAQKGFKDATSGMRKQLAIGSIKDPLMAYGAAEGLGGFKLGAEGLGKTTGGMSAWDSLMSQPEFSPFMGSKEKAADPWSSPVWAEQATSTIG